MIKRFVRFMWLGLFCLLSACGTPSPNPIEARHPLYLLMTNNQQMVLAVLNRPGYVLAGTLPLGNVGSTPPSGDIRIAPDGSVIVTHTGAFLNAQETVKPETLLCTPKHGQCSSLITGWGSATVNTFGQNMAVPVWQNSDPTHGQVMILSGAPVKIAHRIQLASILPGVMQVAPDGKNLYWLAPPDDRSGSSTYRLIRFDLASQTITATYDFGTAVPGGLAVATDETVYATILYTRQFKQAQSAGPTSDPGTLVLVFHPDLQPQGQFTVGPKPVQILVNTTDNIAVTYADDQTHHIDVFSRTDFHLLHTLSSPYQGVLEHLSLLSSGEFAVSVNAGAQTHLGAWFPASDHIEWHTVAGTSIGGIAG